MGHSVTISTTIHIASDFANKYLIINEAGQGNCGKVLFCVSASSASNEPKDSRQSTAVVAVKTAQIGSLGLGLAQEILALQRIQSLLTGSQVEQQLPALINYNLSAAEPRSHWLAINAIQGFNLVQLIKALILSAPVCSPKNSLPHNTTSTPTLPATLILHITQQLVQTVAWLHTTANIAHGDIFSGNIMLDIFRCSFSTNPVILPSLVLIDFDGATLAPNDILRAADRSSVYEFLFSLGELMQVLIENRLDWGVRASTMGFKEFCAKFEGEMVRRVESGVDVDVEKARELVERVVAMSEVEFPGEEVVKEVLERGRGLK
ncbi:hypothetical protein COCVIDRAFT_32764 [Bipolaris victoriae FI3]|uniref:Protein kinase domain-containing protein n=1 Tax=Bipolaris victoriae (strain FI3) TaxID=930091 RepID=W7EQR9_BIPV3|nr:hypothetical protein COCVIDRAFT_32764 [Bipolaris victoriae FI3]